MKLHPETHSGTLLDVPPGGQARVVELNGMPARQRENLQAYGLTPGCWVSVIQHAPVTVIQIENTELAMEADLAGLVAVEAVSAAHPGRAGGRGRRRRKGRMHRRRK